MLYDRLRNVEEAGDNILRRHEGPGSKRMEEAEERKAFMSNLARAGLRRQQEATETPRRTPQAFVRWPEEVERPKPRPDYSRRARPLRTYIDPGTGANPWIRPVPKYSGRNLENRYPKRLGPASGRR
jgi:hypothetical protein